MAETPKPVPSKPAANKVVAKPKTSAAKPAAKIAAKPEKKVVVKPAVKPVAKKVATPKVATKKVAKPAKAPKVKMIRDSFSLPAPDHALLTTLKKSCQDQGRKVKKSDLLRAGISLLSKLSPGELAKLV
ncbi:MAG: hypothetical protein K8Q92_04595 [Methylophilales bacterium]|nr:hypothetical protein [Methylophilales bacterium]